MTAFTPIESVYIFATFGHRIICDILQLCDQDRRWVRPQFLVHEHPQRQQVEDGAADSHGAGDVPTQQKVAHR